MEYIVPFTIFSLLVIFILMLRERNIEQMASKDYNEKIYTNKDTLESLNKKYNELTSNINELKGKNNKNKKNINKNKKGINVLKDK